MTDLDVIEAELAAYVPDNALGGRPLSERTRIVVLNKADVPDARDLAEMVRPDLEERGLEVHIVSAVAHIGLKELTFSLAISVAALGAASATPAGLGSSSPAGGPPVGIGLGCARAVEGSATVEASATVSAGAARIEARRGERANIERAPGAGGCRCDKTR